MLESTRIKSSKKFPHFQGNTSPVTVQAGFDKVLMNQSQPSQLQIFKVRDIWSFNAALTGKLGAQRVIFPSEALC